MRGKLGLFSRLQPFSPANLSGLTGWWDASDSSTLFDDTTGGSAVAADGEVARIEDKSGASRHFTQSSSSFRPIRKTSVKNGLDVLRFDGSNDRMSSTAIFSDIVSATASTVFVVANATSLGVNSTVLNANAVVLTEESGSHGFFATRTNGSVFAFATSTAPASVNSLIIYGADFWSVFSSRHSASNLRARSNGTDSTLPNANGETISTLGSVSSALRLASNYDASRFFTGDVGEIVAYNVALSVSDRNEVETYLRDKWSI
jgi:hypothetical protein